MLQSISTAQILLVLAILPIVHVILKAVYNLYFHPLSRFPGQRLWAVSRIPYAWNLAKGDLTQRTKELHDTYGPVVRLAPNELSFIDGQAWHDIYNHHQGSPNFPKNPLWMAPGENGIHSILSANDADHARYRRLLSHAFSERALMQQEDLILSYIDLLISRLREHASSPDKVVVDLVQWFNFTTFDIVGDLSLGESFGCLEESRYHGWVSILFTQFKAAALFISLRFFGLDKPLRLIIPKSLLKKRADHARMANERIHRRLSQGTVADAQRNDFMTYILRHNDEKGMSIPEIEQTLRVLVVAGSETTATALSGIVRNLLQNPETLQQITAEIRRSFQHPSEICAQRVTTMPYLGAVIEEGLRLCPPVALGMPRVVPEGGATVSGHWLPQGTFVSATGYSSNRSALNFPDRPSTFDPSRWLSNSSQTLSSDTKPSDLKSAFNPFSLGPRNCLGRNLAYLEMRLILAHLLWAFDLEVPKGEGQEVLRNWEEQKSWILWEKVPLMWVGYEVLTASGIGIAAQQGIVAVQAILPQESVTVGSSLILFAQSLLAAIFISAGNSLLRNELLKGLSRAQLPRREHFDHSSGCATQITSLVPEAQLGTFLGLYNLALDRVLMLAVPLAALGFSGALPMAWRSTGPLKAGDRSEA
ncbi:hypothetical protein MMC11_006660 [Xylographa trunciseda]|nr:hypothetical protein [Xylographa trunciseda]